MAESTQQAVMIAGKLSHRYGHKPILFDVNLRVYEGQVLALVGPSGCGKSTLLNAIVGTLRPTEGSIVIARNGGYVQIDGPGRDRGIVYQRYGLYPFLTALHNVAFGLMLDQESLSSRFFLYPRWRRLRRQHLEQAKELLCRLKLENALNQYPGEMSGGMCQRVALAQALIMKPRILLLDEPFGALDEATREDLQWMIRQLSGENRDAIARSIPPPHSIIIVTHEINEALFVSDRVVGLSQYWNWKGEGFSHCPGATIIYDQMSPVYELKEARDLTIFHEQKQDILNRVFDPSIPSDRFDGIQHNERPQKPAGAHGG
jgi:NitT/TauT family transport system ATP-binding protein